MIKRLKLLKKKTTEEEKKTNIVVSSAGAGQPSISTLSQQSNTCDTVYMHIVSNIISQRASATIIIN